MPRYQVTVKYEQEKEIGVWADDEEEAKDKAAEIVMGWSGVIDAEAMDVNEE